MAILPDKGGNDQGTETGLLTYKIPLYFKGLQIFHDYLIVILKSEMLERTENEVKLIKPSL